LGSISPIAFIFARHRTLTRVSQSAQDGKHRLLISAEEVPVRSCPPPAATPSTPTSMPVTPNPVNRLPPATSRVRADFPTASEFAILYEGVAVDRYPETHQTGDSDRQLRL
jgi:hypothetical protein